MNWNKIYKPIQPESAFNKHFNNLVDESNKSGKWKSQLSVKIVFQSWKDIDENADIYSCNDNTEIMVIEKSDKTIEELT